jgi:transcriptional regulator with XRE-family HTH domain
MHTLVAMSQLKQDKFLNGLSKRIADIRRQKGFTQERLAEESEIDRVALANIETGRRRPTVTTLYKLSQALNIKVEEFFKGL